MKNLVHHTELFLTILHTCTSEYSITKNLWRWEKETLEKYIKAYTSFSSEKQQEYIERILKMVEDKEMEPLTILEIIRNAADKGIPEYGKGTITGKPVSSLWQVVLKPENIVLREKEEFWIPLPNEYYQSQAYATKRAIQLEESDAAVSNKGMFINGMDYIYSPIKL